MAGAQFPSRAPNSIMAKKLVIVESPAKAKTIRQFLGPEYAVEASIGHVRDLPGNRKGLPANLQGKWWADYAVDVDNGFEPHYEVPAEKRKAVEHLRTALRDASELVLATDEDREGESISWHLLEVLKPAKSVEVKRIAFHEITREAIAEALRNPRQIDRKLVEAQEARRILDRLYGYTLSPVLWGKIAKELSAGRVQSPAVKLIVERAKRRRDFVTAAFWDLRAELAVNGDSFTAILREADGTRLVAGKDFDELTGKPTSDKLLWLEETAASELADSALGSRPWRVSRLVRSPGQEKPPAPFRTTTLQQEANRKFGFSADRTMRVAQDLYEGVEVDGSRVGLITYMRTDSLHLADSAVRSAREEIRKRFGDEHVPQKPNRYSSKVANAQEAHEAIRPTEFGRTPDSISSALRALGEAHVKLYDLIYRRALASQMKPAEVMRTTADIEVQAGDRRLSFEATGKEISFPGFLLAYVEDVDDPETELESKERVLPSLQEGQEVRANAVTPVKRETKPPPRYTDATLIKALEDLGIGRPSTYASILSVIEDRGYVRKEKRELIATWLSFLAMEILENHFAEFMDLKFTAAMDSTLDAIANGKDDAKAYLQRFFFGGNGDPGLREAVRERRREIPFPSIRLGAEPSSGKAVAVRMGKNGRPFLQVGDGEDRRFANIPSSVDPEDLSLTRALELISGDPPAPESIGVHPVSGKRLLLRERNGYYLEVERTPQEVEAKVKPTWVALPTGVDPRHLSEAEIAFLCSLPKTIGEHPETGEPILFRLGKYGPFIQSGEEMRSVGDWRDGISLNVAQCVEILSQPKEAASRKARKSAGPILEFGELAGAKGPVRVLAGRYGPYVTDGKTNATLPKGTDPKSVTPEMAMELLRARAAAVEANGSQGRPYRRRRFASKRRK